MEEGLEQRPIRKARVEMNKKSLYCLDFGGVSWPSKNKNRDSTQKKPPKVSLSPETQATDST